MLASVTSLPVIGVPVALDRLDGLDSLLSIVQMPRGVPVATVAVNGAANAALLAVRILSVDDARARRRRSTGTARRWRTRRTARTRGSAGAMTELADRLGLAAGGRALLITADDFGLCHASTMGVA